MRNHLMYIYLYALKQQGNCVYKHMYIQTCTYVRTCELVVGGEGGEGAPTLVCGCVCPLLLGGEMREGDSGMTEGGWGVAGLCWAQGIWSPGVPGVSSEGVGLDSS